MAAASQYGNAIISPGFVARKSKILSDLSVPNAEYTDLSPKGSVDEGIRDLIRDINVLDGLVTTSSCAGRVSIFVEGSKRIKKTRITRESCVSENASIALPPNTATRPDASRADYQNAGQCQNQPAANGNDTVNNTRNGKYDGEGEDEVEGRMFAPAGGKGEGRWLYVSHDPVNLDGSANEMKASYHELFGLVPGNGILNHKASDGRSIRLIRFHYDPMILHVMTATLYHAHPVLAAASIAGFRESGLQSLRCLEFSQSKHSSSADAASHSPIVAVRSSGLALESVIGYCEYSSDDAQPVMRSLVTEEYLCMLVALANERFKVNKERVERFRTKLLDLYAASPNVAPSTTHKKMASDWEDPHVRRERKRTEGLRKQAEMSGQKPPISESDDASNYLIMDLY